jgi:hypothetical protein
VADVRIDGQQLVSRPTDIDVSEDVVVTLRKVIHNSGPYGPVDVSISASASAPPDCTATPDPANPASASLPVSANVVIDETWTIHCSAKSSHDFFFDNQITIKDSGVIDPDLGNNFASTQMAVDVWALADLNMLDQYVEDPPAEIAVHEDVPITVISVIHNGGPFGSVEALAETIVTWPSVCQVSPPDGHLEHIRNLPVSVDVTLKAPFVIRCDEAGQHTFEFDNTMDVEMQHVRDPNPGNDTAHTELTVTTS